ncbi:MAG: hypothetical protein K9L30_12930 [Desulfobacterales bacterium]|nr:hypothetical protein [Desulfobacterales bacterium]
MITFEEAIKKGDYPAAEKCFLEDAGRYLREGRYSLVRQRIELFPNDYRQDKPLLSFYHCVSIHLIEPFATRKKFFELIEYFYKKKSYDRVSLIYSTLLINYMYYEETNDKLLTLTQKAQKFIEKHESDLKDEYRKILKIWVQLGKWWIFLEYDRAFEIAMQAEEISLELKDEVALIFSRMALGRLYLELGKFKKALAQYEKAERVIAMSNANRMYEPFVRWFKANTYLYMRSISEAREEAEKGKAGLDKGSAFYYHLCLIELFCNFYTKNLEPCEAIIDKILYEYPDPNSEFRIYVMLFGQLLLSYLGEDRVKTDYYCKRLSQTENSKFYMYEYPLTYLHVAEANLFINDFKATYNTLNNLINETPENRFPHAVATAQALMGLLYIRSKEEAKAIKCFDIMKRMMVAYEIEELEIINIDVLKEIAYMSDSKAIQNFVGQYYQAPIPGSESGESPIRKKVREENSSTTHHIIEIYTFGNLKIFINGRQISSVQLGRQKKLINLLKLIIVNRDKGLPKEIVCDRFWDGYSAESARNNLNMLLSRIRKLFGKDRSFISSETDSIRLIKGGYWLDVNEFENSFFQGENQYQKGNTQEALAAFEQAVTFYQDDFLINDLYEDDINETREILKRKLIHALFKSTGLYLNNGDYHKAHQSAQKMIASDPYCETGYRLLFMATVFSGNRSGLTQVYNKLCDKLQNDLSVEPEVKTQELMKRLIQGAIPSHRMWESEELF